jgi:hypothetical protein
MTKLEAELKTFGGGSQREQFITFWNWYFQAKEKNVLLKPENKEELLQDPDAPKCDYHSSSEGQWYCNREKIPKEVCRQTYRKFGKSCLPRRVLEKRLKEETRIEKTRQEQRRYSGSSRNKNYDALAPGKNWVDPEVWKEDVGRNMINF